MMIVDAILANLSSLIPVKIVRSYQQGVKFRRGVDIAELGAGWHWYIPFYEDIEVLDCNEQGVDCLVQSITTKVDDKGYSAEVTLSANIFYQIASVRTLYIGLQDWDHNIERAARRYIAKKARSWTYSELVEHQNDLESSLRTTLTTKFSRWGLEITDLGITDFTRTRSFRHYGSVL